MFLLKLASRLPTLSPTDNSWPQEAPNSLVPLNEYLRGIYVDHRALLFRKAVDHRAQATLREKLIASQVCVLHVYGKRPVHFIFAAV